MDRGPRQLKSNCPWQQNYRIKTKSQKIAKILSTVKVSYLSVSVTRAWLPHDKWFPLILLFCSSQTKDWKVAPWDTGLCGTFFITRDGQKFNIGYPIWFIIITISIQIVYILERFSLYNKKSNLWKFQYSSSQIIFRTSLVIFRTNPFINRTYSFIFKTNPVIFKVKISPISEKSSHISDKSSNIQD